MPDRLLDRGLLIVALGFAREAATVAALDINGETAAKTAADIRAAVAIVMADGGYRVI